MKNKCAIILNGELNDIENLKFHLKNIDFIIGVDGGLRYLSKTGYQPNLILGDFDSYNLDENDKFKNVETLKYNSEKDYTDGEIAINYVIDNKFDEVVILGALGGRIDHMMSNVNMLEKLNDNAIKGSIVSEDTVLKVIDNNNSIILKYNELNEFNYFSVISISEKLEGLTIKNAKYLVEDIGLSRTESRGLSNEFVKNKDAVIEVSNGKGLILVSKK